MRLFVPFTPLHIGPSSWLGLGFFKKISLPGLFIGSVIIDVEPIIVLIFNLNYPLHGYLHTYFGAFVMGLATVLICYSFQSVFSQILTFFSLNQESNNQAIVFGAFLGTFSHILLDSFLYPEMNPFFPIIGNPFFNVLPSGFIYGFCLLSFIPGFILFFYRIHHVNMQKKD